ncbi:MAG: hydrogenase expression/formation protein HypE [Dehalococcoidia bacterium]|nr:hydrogenase expression/formation protein HypE [Dehalococcoidia bacterium]MDD5493955.1 hydrogenase expression/formation protein HypE [Dehalococcoidia bacterium]
MNDRILLAHGSGSKLSHDLLEKILVPPISNPLLARMDDAAVFELAGKLAFTTDSYVVNPIFFPGGDIGRLAVCGTVNDLSMSGAEPLYISLALIIEEGLEIAELLRIIQSVKDTCEEAGVQVITGDTKVVNRGKADKLFINTAGIGSIHRGLDISGSNARVGDKIILSGGIGEHGIAVMSQREGLQFSVPVQSDCAPLNKLVADMLRASKKINCLRDPTRGGLAATLSEFARQSDVGIIIEEEKIPLHDGVRGACELLGLDPLYIANEGKLVAVVSPDDADRVLKAMKRNKYAGAAAVIGEVTAGHRGRVVMKTKIGASRIVDMPTGEILPRIC